MSITTDKSSWSLPVTTLLAEYDGQHPSVGLKLGFTPELEVSVTTKDLKELNLGWAYHQVLRGPKEGFLCQDD